MRECSKSIPRRLGDSRFTRKYFVGIGIDVGGKPDPLVLYQELFPLIKSVRTWDIEDGDAQFLEDVEDETYDFLHSSHCLEHLIDPYEGLKNWLRVVKKGGYLIITVPDEDMYEQGVFPSQFNRDHKWTFTVYKETSWNQRSVNILDLVRMLGDAVAVEKIEVLDSTYRYALPRYDQTLTPVAECGIELILRKRTEKEIHDKGRLPGCKQPLREIRIHLNQYRSDMATLKETNRIKPPFTDESEL